MKKILLFSLLTLILLGASHTWAQQAATSKVHLYPTSNLKSLKPLPVATMRKVNDNISLPVSSSVKLPVRHQLTIGQRTEGSLGSQTLIGTTQYDNQTNNAISDRFLFNSDGTMSAAWTTYCPSGTSADRGSGYNYFDGTSWNTPPCARVEPTDRTGFINIGVTSSGKEFVLGHSSTALGMLITSRPIKGTGDWTEDPTALGNNPDDTWAKIAVGGADGKTIHAIWNASGLGTNVYCGQLGAIVYSRSTDDGVTWPVLHACIPAIDSSSYLGFGADDYQIDAQGNNVAIAVSDQTTDLVLLKSTDNGDTWTKQVVVPFYKPFFDPTNDIIDTNSDGIPDTIFVPSGDVNLKYDKTGMIHLVYSNTLVLDPDSTGVSFYPTVDGGIWYWNESMGDNPPVLIASAQDFNNDSLIDLPTGGASSYGAGVYNSGLSLQPTIGFDDNNNIFVAYSTYDENSDTTAFQCGYRHLYIIYSTDNGASWSNPLDVANNSEDSITAAIEEDVYACIAPRIDTSMRIIYENDLAPGNQGSPSPQSTWNAGASNISYAQFSNPLITGIPHVISHSFTVSQNVPNPANGTTQITVGLAKASPVQIIVHDLIGKTVYSTPPTNFSIGSNRISLDLRNLSSGVYFYDVKVGDDKITKKMVVD